MKPLYVPKGKAKDKLYGIPRKGISNKRCLD